LYPSSAEVSLSIAPTTVFKELLLNNMCNDAIGEVLDSAMCGTITLKPVDSRARGLLPAVCEVSLISLSTSDSGLKGRGTGESGCTISRELLL
jgi:hypothetical protein